MRKSIIKIIVASRIMQRPFKITPIKLLLHNTNFPINLSYIQLILFINRKYIKLLDFQSFSIIVIMNEMSINFTTTYNPENGYIQFNGDLSEMAFERCMKILRLYKNKAVDDSLEWLLFKIWFDSKFAEEMPAVNLKEFFTSSNITGQQPIMFGRFLVLAIRTYFSQNVTDMVDNQSSGLGFYVELNTMLSNNTGTDVILIKKLLSLMESNPKLEELSKALNIIGYYIPAIKLLSSYLFIANIPRKDVVDFMKSMNIYDVNQKNFASEIPVRQVLTHYKRFKAENVNSWETNTANAISDIGQN